MAGLHLPLYKPNLIRSSSSHPPSAYTRSTVLVPVTQTQSYWDTIYSDIDSHLKKSIPIREPITVFEPMHHLTFSPPKTTASALCVAACEVVGGNREDAIVAASAIHLMHAAIYIHDHLILTGRVGSEPGSESTEIQHRFGSNIELLTGDGLIPFGFELLARLSADAGADDAEKILKVIIEISKAVGTHGMAGGEDDEVESDQSMGQLSRQLHGCGAACGAIIGGGTAGEIERLKRYGVCVGKVQGLLGENGKCEGGKVGLIEKWRGLALKELEYFDSKKVEQISTVVRL